MEMAVVVEGQEGVVVPGGVSLRGQLFPGGQGGHFDYSLSVRCVCRWAFELPCLYNIELLF